MSNFLGIKSAARYATERSMGRADVLMFDCNREGCLRFFVANVCFVGGESLGTRMGGEGKVWKDSNEMWGGKCEK